MYNASRAMVLHSYTCNYVSDDINPETGKVQHTSVLQVKALAGSGDDRPLHD